MFFLAIKRGRAFIDIAHEQAAESEQLYDNIKEQIECVEQVDNILTQLKSDVQMMKFSSAENKSNVAAIVVAMDDYRENIGRVVENTKVK